MKRALQCWYVSLTILFNLFTMKSPLYDPSKRLYEICYNMHVGHAKLNVFIWLIILVCFAYMRRKPHRNENYCYFKTMWIN